VGQLIWPIVDHIIKTMLRPTLLLLVNLALNCVHQAFSEGRLLNCTAASHLCPAIRSEAIDVPSNDPNLNDTNSYLSPKFREERESFTKDNCSTHSGLSLICSEGAELVQADGVKVHILTPNNETQIELGSSLTLECRFDTKLDQDLRFSLRWLRSVNGSQVNQSIGTTEADSALTIIAATTRIWTVRRNGGLDLELNDFRLDDVGSYFCQAIDESIGGKILDESKVHLTTLKHLNRLLPSADETQEQAEPFTLNSSYSQENLFGLLPSLRVVPEFGEFSLGETVQLFCFSDGLDPDPEPDEIEWTFESMDRRRLLSEPPLASRQLPYNVTTLGNVLVIWSMSANHIGLYKCTTSLAQFNLTVQAAAELSVRPSADSAPLVFVVPELIRLSPNGSATIQCEATGYPAPELVWYRVDGLNDAKMATVDATTLDDAQLLADGLEIERIQYQDSYLYCEQSQSCVTLRSHQPAPVTAISLIKLQSAKAQHQGQYVCQANNKHGSNQASSILDIDFKEPPVVRIAPQFKERMIELTGELADGLGVTFECNIESGRPVPRLRWLKTSSNNLNLNNLDIYDLSKVSSATSNIRTWSENRGKVLVLAINTTSLYDEGDYICLGENEWGRHSAKAKLIVRRPISVKILQPSPVVARVNESFHLDCLATGHPAPLDIEWSRSDRGAFFSLNSRISNMTGSHERAVLKFDRVSAEDSGEYACNARDPLNSSLIHRDTIMVLVEDLRSKSVEDRSKIRMLSQLPKLIVRPTKASARVGENITLDCLAVSGLQPTLVEWLAPPQFVEQPNSSLGGAPIWSYYHDSLPGGRLIQFGSKLRILNVSKSHEGVYQCKGRNKVGTENAPALVKVFDPLSSSKETINSEQSTLSTRTKVARVGSNIELKCQVSGIEQPATSWSRDGLELPASSVQIEHNLWIQNVSQSDSGLYVCSARAKQPNRVIQAKINLSVDGQYDSTSAVQNLSAKIVASKGTVYVGDAITLECIISRLQNVSMDSELGSKLVDLEEIERNVVWTNLHSGQTLFQDNVYLQNNLLIIYELRPENSATYRCNYNELSQHVDYKLQVVDPNSTTVPNTTHDPFNTGSASLGQQPKQTILTATNGLSAQLRQIPLDSRLTINCSPLVPTLPAHNLTDSGFYWTRGNEGRRFGRANGSLVFESVQAADADAYHCHESSHRRVHTLVVQVLVPVARFAQRPVSFISLPTIAAADHQLEIEMKFLAERDHGLMLFNGQQKVNRSAPSGDYISLGLNRGHLEFKFELGDGPTSLRSLHPLALDQWHRVAIERNRRGAVMWLDKQPPVSNSSAGKFFNLNLDSVLYVGGNQHFLNKSKSSRFHGYSGGFQGCISMLRISRNEINLMAQNRSVSIGVYECDKSECQTSECSQPNGVCQVDRAASRGRVEPARRVAPHADLRCICLPGFAGSQCRRQLPAINSELVEHLNRQPNSTIKPAGGACASLSPCATNGTLRCQSLTSVSFKCHCKLGFSGETCAQWTEFPNETSVHFNQQAYLQLRFNRPEEVQTMLQQQQLVAQANSAGLQHEIGAHFNATNFSRLTSMIEGQNITFRLKTNSSYGLIFYNGQASLLDSANSSSNEFMSQSQNSKSPVANLLARLSNLVFDYLAIALIDGHVELSYELGSGPAIIRSSQRVNDGLEHQLSVLRSGKFARLIIDERAKYEGSSPGKLSMLNSPADFYLGGLPNLAELTNNMYMSGFVGCLSQLQINSLGPLNLIKSDHLSQVRSAQNLSPCETWRGGEADSRSQLQRQRPYQEPKQSEGDDPDEM